MLGIVVVVVVVVESLVVSSASRHCGCSWGLKKGFWFRLVSKVRLKLGLDRCSC
jgi:hypothetical protein